MNSWKAKVLFLTILSAIIIMVGVVLFSNEEGKTQDLRLEAVRYQKRSLEIRQERLRSILMAEMEGTKQGKASWYDYSLEGDIFYSREHFTAASRDWPRGTMLIVCRIQDPPQIVQFCSRVRVNDYGPDENVHPDRIIDLSSAAFRILADPAEGVIDVEVRKDINQ